MIYIVRHGQTELNNRRVLQGRSDHPLNAQGVAQAKAVLFFILVAGIGLAQLAYTRKREVQQ